MGMMEPAIISRLGESNVLKLEPYGYDGLIGICKQRYEASCRSGSVSDDILEKIGRFAEGTGDARLAIELLEAAVRRAEMNGRGEVALNDVMPSNIRSASVEPSQVDSLSLIRNLYFSIEDYVRKRRYQVEMLGSCMKWSVRNLG